MAAMKPRTGDGPLEVTKEGRGIVMRVPLEGGGRLVVELNADEAGALAGRAQGRRRLTCPLLHSKHYPHRSFPRGSPGRKGLCMPWERASRSSWPCRCSRPSRRTTPRVPPWAPVPPTSPTSSGSTCSPSSSTTRPPARPARCTVTRSLGHAGVREVLLVGVGDTGSDALRAAGAALARACRDREVVATTIAGLADDDGLRAFVVGLTLGSFGFHARSAGAKAAAGTPGAAGGVRRPVDRADGRARQGGGRGRRRLDGPLPGHRALQRQEPRLARRPRPRGRRRGRAHRQGLGREAARGRRLRRHPRRRRRPRRPRPG